MSTEGIRSGKAVVSSQVLSEFWITVTRKIQVPMEVTAAESELDRFACMKIVPIDYGTVRAAIHFQHRYRISYWDALVVAAAHMGRCNVLYSEDLNGGQRYGEVVARNPFANLSG
jgi:predicted nucleic acid-binding protein